MKFQEYFKLTKSTSNVLMNICVLIFSIIAIIITILTEYENLNFITFLQYLSISIFFGFLMSAFILIVAISTAFHKAKSIINLYNSTPQQIREKYGLNLYEKNQNPKYNFLELEIVATKTTGFPMKFDVVGKQIWLIIFNNLANIENFEKKRLIVQKNYRKEKIELTGWGLKKIVLEKEWINTTENELEKTINRLKSISEIENLELLMDIEKTGYNKI